MKFRDQPCKCGWKFPGFHICIDLSTPEPRIKKTLHSSMSQLAALAEGRAKRHATYLEEHAERDQKIVELYNQGDVSQPQVAEQIGCSQSTVQKVLKQAAVDGLVEVRKRGLNISKSSN